MAHELLQTRVDSKVLARRDALGDLGRDFDRMAERIETLVVAERRLLTDVTHALRSPLERLSTALKLARAQTGPDTAPHLDRIEHELAAVDTLVGQLLTMARIDSGVDLPNRGPVDVRATVQETVADAAPEARARNCGVNIDAPDECRVNASRELLRGAIDAVVRNAVRRSPTGGAVDISVRADPLSRPAGAVVSVRDHGPDLPHDVIERLFYPFNQGPDDVVPERLDGAGLDLAITKRSCELFGGKVGAASAPGGGLLVTMTLPLG
jgi:signal transduction histidine kinase